MSARPSLTSLTPRRRDAESEPSFADTLPLWARGALAALVGALLSVLVVVTPVLVVWMTSRYAAGTGWDATRVGIVGWLAGQGVPVWLGDRPLTLAPWLLAVVPFAALVWAAQWALALVPRGSAGRGAAGRSAPVERLGHWAGLRRDVASCGGSFVAAYTVFVLVLGALSRMSWIAPSLWDCLWRPVVLAGAAYAVGARAAFGEHAGSIAPRLRAAWRGYLPSSVRVAVRPALWAVGAVLLAGLLLTVFVLLARWNRVGGMYGRIDAGPVGSIVLTLAQLLYLPSAAVWGTSWLAGPGFGVGVGTSVTWAGCDVGVIPLVPFLGALPEPGPMPGPTYLAVLLPIAAGGLIAGLTLVEDCGQTWLVRLRTVAVAVALAGVALTVCGVLASGSMGAGRLAAIGVPWTFGPVITGELLLGAVVGFGTDELRRRRPQLFRVRRPAGSAAQAPQAE